MEYACINISLIFLYYTMETDNKGQAYLPSTGHPVAGCLGVL